MTWTMKQGDLDPPYRAQLGVAGVGLDLTGRTVAFLMADAESEPSVAKIVGEATVMAREDVIAAGLAEDGLEDEAYLGWVEYAWEAGDTDTPGLYNADFRTLNGDRPWTFPPVGHLKIRIEKALPTSTT